MTAPAPLSGDERERLRALIELLKPGPWEHWWCGDEHCDCHALEFPLREEPKPWSDKPPRGREVLHMIQPGQGQLLFSGDSETAIEIDAIAAMMNAAPALLAMADESATLRALLVKSREALEACAYALRNDPILAPQITATLAEIEAAVGAGEGKGALEGAAGDERTAGTRGPSAVAAGNVPAEDRSPVPLVDNRAQRVEAVIEAAKAWRGGADKQSGPVTRNLIAAVDALLQAERGGTT